MTLERKPEDQQSGFETSSELRHDEPAESLPPPTGKSMWVGISLLPLVVVVLIVALVIYYLVTSL